MRAKEAVNLDNLFWGVELGLDQKRVGNRRE